MSDMPLAAGGQISNVEQLKVELLRRRNSPLRITVIVPTYNEAENLPKLVSALFTLPLDLRILVVDDNSPDGTGAIG